MIKAIETRYKGYRFRSRLEARWAVFFDALGIEYQYEPQGFEKENPHGEPLRYLPDFLLPKTGTWVEVKGSDELLKAEAEWMEDFLDYSCPLPDFTGSGGNRQYFKVPGLLILGDIPNPDLWGYHFHTLIRHHKGLCREFAQFTPGHIRVFGGPDALNLLSAVVGREMDDEPLWTTVPVFAPTKLGFQKVNDSYRAARSARFEHGETPR